MSGNDEQNVECPLCMEPLEMDDINFYPCTCGYQICRFCWHRIRTDENGLCPACRKQYPEDPADFKPVSSAQLQKIKSEKKQKDQQKKQKLSENRKHLVNVRVVQKNLVFVVGLSQRLADPDVLKKQEYFGKFGKIHKVVINQSTAYAGSQGPSASAYVTYHRGEDTLRAIQAVNNIIVDGRTLKASIGTTKYCSHFLKCQQCPKSDCMYLHDLGDEAASFTKEEMQQGKHQEYERKLHDQLCNSYQPQPTSKEQSSKQTASPASNQQPSTQCKEGWPSLQSSSPNTRSCFSLHMSNWQGCESPSGGEENRGASSGTTKQDTSTAGDHRLPLAEDHRSVRSKERQNSESTSWSSSSIFSQSPTSSSNQQQPSPSSSTSSLSSSPSSTEQKHNLLIEQDESDSFLPDDLTYPQNAGIQLSLEALRLSTENHPPPQVPNYRQSAMPANYDQAIDNSFFSGGNSFAAHDKLASPTTVYSENTEWLNSADDPLPLTSESLPVSSSTDWQAAFGFASSQNNRDDDLGFDPWDESAKALADMIEKENEDNQTMLASRMRNNHYVQPSRYGPQQLLIENQRAAQGRQLVNTSKYPIPQIHGGYHHPLMDGGSHMGMPPLSSQQLQAPPGFMPNQLNYNNVNRPPTLTDFSHSNKVLPQDVNQPSHYVNGTSRYNSESILNNVGYNNHLNDAGINHKAQEAFSMKEWQDNLRSLLPNINVSFDGHTFSQQPTVAHAQQNKGWNNYPQEVYRTADDPAIVTAGNTIHGQTNPHWLQSLQQLTDEPPIMHNNQRVPYPSQYFRTPSWPSVSQTAPPGFAAPLNHTLRHSESQNIVENL